MLGLNFWVDCTAVEEFGSSRTLHRSSTGIKADRRRGESAVGMCVGATALVIRVLNVLVHMHLRHFCFGLG